MRQLDGERGASMVETSVVLLFLAILVLGIIEYGNAFRQATVVEKTVQQSGRVVASVADQALADYEALQTFRSLLDSSDNVTLDYLVIYRSTSADGKVPANCLAASQHDSCNRYVAADLLRPASDFGSCVLGDPDRYWCPTDRERDREPWPDYVGLHARLRYTGITGSLPAPIVIDRSTVYAVEPCAHGLPGC
jgi:Flp pilus assembly protein TadG